jgi:hypothetical protein
MKMICWFLSIISSLIGAIVAVALIGWANGAPQQAAGAAIGIAWAVIPYCIARAVSELDRK